jgi:glutathione S-transferase
MVDFYGESFAPWCEKARWALDHHQIRYRFIEHVPMLGELRLRVAALRPRGRVTVPLLIDGSVVLMDSLAIARRADQLGSSAPLFPAHRERELVLWNERSEALMAAGRALLLGRLAQDTAALREQLPAAIPGAARRLLTPLAALGVRHLKQKYVTDGSDPPTHERACREVMTALRSAGAGSRLYLLGDTLSYADITMATALQFVLPVADDYIQLGAATRRVWTHPTLHAEFEDLTLWRDELYALHR